MRGAFSSSIPFALASIVACAAAVGCSAGGSSSPGGYGGSSVPDASLDAPVAEAGGSGGSGGEEASVNPCEGVNCYDPPANECDGDNLKTYNLSGTCDQGECYYGFKLLACPYGCDTTRGQNLRQEPLGGMGKPEDRPAPENRKACPCEVENGVCIGDACLGVTCVTPPANYCADPSHLNVYDVPGSCTNGACHYETHSEYCDHGCDQGE